MVYPSPSCRRQVDLAGRAAAGWTVPLGTVCDAFLGIAVFTRRSASVGLLSLLAMGWEHLRTARMSSARRMPAFHLWMGADAAEAFEQAVLALIQPRSERTPASRHRAPTGHADASMTLTFLGTRGNVDIRSRRHRRHTSTLVSHRGADVMLDCGADWCSMVHRLAPSAIVVTHAHTDHVDGLRRGAPCPVYAPPAVWRTIERHASITKQLEWCAKVKTYIRRAGGSGRYTGVLPGRSRSDRLAAVPVGQRKPCEENFKRSRLLWNAQRWPGAWL
jgi:hypothetical protein